MKVLAINAGTRRNGNTQKIMDSMLNRSFKNDDIEYINLLDLNFQGCIACYGCAKTGYCVLKDDLTPIYNLIDTSDIIVFSSPVYFNSVSALGKKLIDRMQSYWSKKYILKDKNRIYKKGIFITSGGAPYTTEQFKGSQLVMKHFNRALNCEDNIQILVSNTDEKEVDVKSEEFSFLDNIQEHWNKTFLIKQEV